MKSKFYIFAVAVIMAAVFSGCEKPEKVWENEGFVTTVSATEVSTNHAKLEGIFSPLEAEVTEMGFYYDTTPEMFNIKKAVATDGFSTVVTSLEYGTTYYYYAYATAYGKTKSGDTKMFKTKEPLPLEGTIYGHEYVDLGLPSGLLWATCNVGASNPNDYGIWASPESSVVWGGDWRLPTRSEFQELIGICLSERIGNSINGSINGIKFTGPNGKSIFLPTAGYDGEQTRHYGWYWTSTKVWDEADCIDYYHLFFSSVDINVDCSKSSCSMSIRPCCPY